MTNGAAQRRRVLVVVNETARGGAVGLVDDVQRRCRESGCEPVTLVPTGRRAAVRAIRAALADDGPWYALVAVGGDGTVRTCAEAAAGGDVPIAIVPAGTGNSLYRALWEDRPWSDVLGEALGASIPGDAVRVRQVDLLRVTGGTSELVATAMLGANAGLVAEVVRASEQLTGVSGRERYSAAIGPALEAHVPFPARVTLDGEVLTDGPVSLIAVGGARHRSGTLQLLPRSVLDDGLLDVCVICGVEADAFIELAGAVVAGEHVGLPGVDYAQGRSVVIERTDGGWLPFESDGDLWPVAEHSVTIEVVAPAVAMLAPLQPVAG
ncbi:MAG: diacylglycerol kinase family protein [Acidimicrobiia bacterium]|nr:diacylglycerol kinase family protein [Acidimicrobiia bacterium]